MRSGQDPLEFRRKLMAKHPKHLAVLNAVAEKIGWDKPAPQGVFRGIAQHMGYGSYVAGAAEISVIDGNKIKVHRIVAATDPGYAVNPAQIERADRRLVRLRPDSGCSMAAAPSRMAASSSRISTTTIRCGSPRCRRSKSIVMPSGGFWGGVGEPTICVAATCGAQCVFRGDGKTHPLGAAAGSKHHLRLTLKERRPHWPPLHTGSC